MSELEKELNLPNEAAAEFLREIADALESDEQVNLDGDGWKISQPLGESVPMRLFSDENGLEIGFKLRD